MEEGPILQDLLDGGRDDILVNIHEVDRVSRNSTMIASDRFAAVSGVYVATKFHTAFRNKMLSRWNQNRQGSCWSGALVCCWKTIETHFSMQNDLAQNFSKEVARTGFSMNVAITSFFPWGSVIWEEVLLCPKTLR